MLFSLLQCSNFKTRGDGIIIRAQWKSDQREVDNSDKGENTKLGLIKLDLQTGGYK